MHGDWIRRPRAGTSVVFVHGILSSGEACWRHENGSYWPDLLKNSPGLEPVGIYIFTYQTSIFSGTYRLSDIVDALKEHMQLDGVLAMERIIFVCHSMGGIVVRMFLVERAADLIERGIEIGLFLISSPSLGSSYANWLSPLAQFLGHAQADALRFQQSNAWLNDLDKEFQNLKEGRKLRIHGKELIEDKFVVLKRLWQKQVVEPFSGARYFGDQFKVPNADHFSIAKPEGSDAIQHRLLCQFIESISDVSTSSLTPEVRERTCGPMETTVKVPEIVFDTPEIAVPCIELDWPHVSPPDDELRAFLAEAEYRMALGDSPCCQVTLSSLTAAENTIGDLARKTTLSPEERIKRIEQLQTSDYLRRICSLLERTIEFVVSDELRKKVGWWAIPTVEYFVVVKEMLRDPKSAGTIHAYLANDTDQISAWIYFSRSQLQEIVGHEIQDQTFLSVEDFPIGIDVVDLDSHTQYRGLGVILRKLVERNLDPIENVGILRKEKWRLCGD